ncbi:hypothetical protein BS78_04G221500 [Paspalum vaginatum]|nr:hypothetical protein BS78_04G221500 [Paspalum vaginatum]
MSFSLIRSPQALKRPQLKNSTSITALLVVSFILTLYVTTCEARHLRVHGKHCSSNKLPSSPPKVVVDVGAANGKMMGSSLKDPVGSDGMDASSTCNEAAIVAKKKEVASSGGSLRKSFEGMKVRSGAIGKRSVLGADGSNNEQVASNAATAAYTPETLVAMDYQEAHPAPAVHNR